MMKWINVFSVVCILLVTQSTIAQTVAQLQKAGDKKMVDAEYYAASLYYTDALKKDEDNAQLWYKLGEATRMFNDYGTAAAAYKETAKLDKANELSLASFWAGVMLRSVCTCKNDEAVTYLKKFRSKYKKKDEYSAKAQQELSACAWAAENQTLVDSIKIEHLGKDINTPQSEFNAIHVYPDKIQFSSLRNLSDDKKNPDYKVRLYNQPPNLELMYMPNGADTQLNIGNGAYSLDVKQFYFTQCQAASKGTSRCDVYVSRFENYKWTNAEKLSINLADATTTQPTLGKNEKGETVLFFSSDRAGGEGGLDLWSSQMNADGSLATPINLGKTVNTPGNEITPHYDWQNKELYFSSDWHYGFGGYDIFLTKENNGTWAKPINLLQPVNTSQNDLYYALASDNSKAYITSNRKGSYFIEAETCCNDIYAYNTKRKVAPFDTTTKPLITQEILPTPVRDLFDGDLKKIKQLLPVSLYFHNDEPDARTMSDTTSLDYKTTYERYVAMEREYIQSFAIGLTKAEKDEAQKRIATFFNQKVEKGFYDLVGFSAQTLRLLEQGKTIEITIQGHCSPLNYNLYNINLGYRRIASLRNYFYHYRDGVLNDFIAKGQLVLKNVSMGEEKASTGISDDRLDTRNSVYHPDAAIERRVEIISVEVK
jgi:hypothetical protein